VTTITRLGINKLFLWSEASRFQTYPKAMAKLEQGRSYTRQQIGEDLFGLVYGRSGKLKRENLLSNLFGALQIAPDKLLLRGINLFRRITPNGPRHVSGITKWELADDEWLPTEAALQLGISYRQEPNGIQWQRQLAEQIARYEPRTRVLLHLLANGHSLRFESSGYFAGNTQQAQLVSQRAAYPLFGEQGAAFNTLLFEYAEIAVGPWWRAEIEAMGFELSEEVLLQGAMNRPPSTNYINSALKTALYVFYSLGILTENRTAWTVDPEALAQHLDAEIARGLLGESYAVPDLFDEWRQLAYVVQQLSDERGFVMTSEAAHRWGDLAGLAPSECVTAFDTLMRRGIFEGRVEIVDRHPGQPRMGRGLFGDDNMRMVYLRVLT
jgi:hypothetical protein